MLPIVFKDLFNNLKIWLLFVLTSSVSVVTLPEGIIYGFTQALTFGGGLLFSHSVISAERERRHLVFLRSLPIKDSAIVSAKFTSVLILTLSLAGAPHLTGLLAGDHELNGEAIKGLSLLILYVCLVLSLNICFRNPAIPFLPLYIAAFCVVWTEPATGYRLGSGTTATILSAILISVVIYSLTLFVFRRKELDL